MDVGKQTTHGPQMVRRAEEAKGTIMPMVNGKKYPYTKSGKAAAKKAKKKDAKKNTPRVRRSGMVAGA